MFSKKISTKLPSYNLFQAIYNDDLQTIISILTQHPKIINSKDKKGDTPLTQACIFGNIEIVKFLLENNASINSSNNCGHTPLINACKSGKFDIVKLLIKNNANVNLQDIGLRTLLMYACISGESESLKALLSNEEIKVHIKDTNGRTALHFACMYS